VEEKMHKPFITFTIDGINPTLEAFPRINNTVSHITLLANPDIPTKVFQPR
jgi:hypothetical protein